MNQQWQNKIEEQIKELAISIKELVVTMNKHIEHSREMQEIKFTQIEKTQTDHEERIRKNTKFIYQATAIIAVMTAAFNYFLRMK
ncbi:MAG: hypothetical protein ACRCTJ_02335 [Brevinema sp.]